MVTVAEILIETQMMMVTAFSICQTIALSVSQIGILHSITMEMVAMMILKIRMMIVMATLTAQIHAHEATLELPGQGWILTKMAA